MDIEKYIGMLNRTVLNAHFTQHGTLPDDCLRIDTVNRSLIKAVNNYIVYRLERCRYYSMKYMNTVYNIFIYYITENIPKLSDPPNNFHINIYRNYINQLQKDVLDYLNRFLSYMDDEWDYMINDELFSGFCKLWEIPLIQKHPIEWIKRSNYISDNNINNYIDMLYIFGLCKNINDIIPFIEYLLNDMDDIKSLIKILGDIIDLLKKSPQLINEYVESLKIHGNSM